MATLRDIKNSIKSVGNIKKITRAMQLVAAAKLNKAQQRAATVRPYADELEGILGTLANMVGDESGDVAVELALLDDQPPAITTRERLFSAASDRKPGVVLMTADRGLCGAFNSSLIRESQKLLNELSDKDPQLITIGKKGHAFWKINGREPIYHRDGLSDKLDIGEIREVTGNLVNLYLSGQVDSLTVVFAKAGRGASYQITRQQFLPIPPIEGVASDESYIMEPDPDSVFASMIPLYATTTIFSSLADMFASEYAAKLAAMQQATNNADEKLSDLIILRNRLRQATITKELAEIVGGAEALK